MGMFMKTILVSAFNLKTGGGKKILFDYFNYICNNDYYNKYIFLVPYSDSFDKCRENIIILELEKIFKNRLLFPLVLKKKIKEIIVEYNVDTIFNLGNIAIPTNKYQVLLFHWAYAVYKESEIWKRMDTMSYINRKIRLFFFSKYLPYADEVIVQTNTIKKRLESTYGIKNIHVIPNTIETSINDVKEKKCINKEDTKKLLYLTHYYPHKNIEILIPLARLMKEKRINYKIIITINKNESRKARELLKKIEEYSLKDYIDNIGTIDPVNIKKLYSEVDALLMPTILESYGFPYLEAMANNKTIFTSNLDFARDVCRGAAFYFDPFSEEDILNVIIDAFDKPEKIKKRIEAGNMIINNLTNNEDIFHKYNKLLFK